MPQSSQNVVPRRFKTQIVVEIADLDNSTTSKSMCVHRASMYHHTTTTWQKNQIYYNSNFSKSFEQHNPIFGNG
jgi:hypothetical protein